jgi:hypothetical protein
MRRLLFRLALALLQKAECLYAGRKRTIDEMRQKGLKE